jgi:hypothetical protein
MPQNIEDHRTDLLFSVRAFFNISRSSKSSDASATAYLLIRTLLHDPDELVIIGRCSGGANRSIVVGQLGHSHRHRRIVDPSGQAEEAGAMQNMANWMGQPIMDQPPQLDVQIVRECPH